MKLEKGAKSIVNGQSTSELTMIRTDVADANMPIAERRRRRQTGPLNKHMLYEAAEMEKSAA